MKQLRPLTFFRAMKFSCVLCGSNRSLIYPWRIFQRRLTVPICFGCEKKHGTPGQDTITPVLEAKLMEIFAEEKAFWHPGEKIDVEPQNAAKEIIDGN